MKVVCPLVLASSLLLTPSLCGRIARESRCKTLCLTHFFPICVPEEAARICSSQFDGEILLAKDLTTIDL